MIKSMYKNLLILFILSNLCFSNLLGAQENAEQKDAKQENVEASEIEKEFNENLERLEKTQNNLLDQIMDIDETIKHIKTQGHSDDNTLKKVQELTISKAKSEYEELLKTNNEELILNAKNTLLNELEKTIPLVCMPKFHKELDYTPNKENEKCESLINDLLKIYPYSPIGLCAKFGYNNEKCKEAYSHIIISSGSPSKSKEKKEIPELKEFFKSIDSIKIPKLKDDYVKAKQLYNSQNTTSNFLKVISIGDKIVRNLCRDKKEEYSDKCATCNEKNKIKLNPLNLFSDIKNLTKNENKEDEDKPSNDDKKIKQVDKIIYLSSDCQDFLNDISEFEPKYPSSICEQSGIYSPKCLEALKAWPLYIKSKYDMENNNKKPVEVKPTTDPNAFESF